MKQEGFRGGGRGGSTVKGTEQSGRTGEDRDGERHGGIMRPEEVESDRLPPQASAR